MVTNLTDEQLVELAVMENHEAFGVIVSRWERKIFALCYGMLNREDEAKDAAQETFIAAYRNLKNFRGDAKVSSWLHRIAVNQCLTTKRRTKTRSESFLDDEENAEDKVFVAPTALQTSLADCAPVGGSRLGALTANCDLVLGQTDPELQPLSKDSLQGTPPSAVQSKRRG
jgi:RNA polymerase sigma factor (sigma-70 family)